MVPNVWALVVTAKASRLDLAKFCSFHLDQGAERIFLYLEDSDARTADILSFIPQIELTVTDEPIGKIATGPPQSKIGKAKMHSMPIDVSKVILTCPVLGSCGSKPLQRHVIRPLQPVFGGIAGCPVDIVNRIGVARACRPVRGRQVRQPAMNIVDAADLVQHVQHRLIRAAMRRSPQGCDTCGDTGKRVRTGGSC